MKYVIGLDTNVLWDVGRHREYRKLEAGTRVSIRAFEQSMQWLSALGRVIVVAPLFSLVEYINLIRDDYHIKGLMERQGLHPRQVVRYRKSYKSMEEDDRISFTEEADEKIANNSHWIEARWRISDTERFGELVRKVILESPLSIEDAYVFAGAIDCGAKCFVSGDGDFDVETEKKLRRFVADEDFLFLNHRRFAREIREDLGGSQKPARKRPLRAQLLSRVFDDPGAGLGGYTIGKAYQMIRDNKGRTVLLYKHTSDVNKLSVGMRIAIIGQSYFRGLDVHRIEVDKSERPNVICMIKHEEIRVGVEVSPSKGAIWDPSEPSDGDTVFVEPPASST